MEEIAARQPVSDRAFLDQAVQVVVEEIETLERRVRAFSEFASEPAMDPSVIDISKLILERVELLRAAHPEVVYRFELAPELLMAFADPDQVKGILTNLLTNAAEAADGNGEVLVRSFEQERKACVEVHDSGPGLSREARATLFEPTISFKKHGLGLGLSIARKNALMAGGDLVLIDGRLSGAAFRLTLPSQR
jgi:nitrogen fixation/metabolism regulation signal transduction histidine kinase